MKVKVLASGLLCSAVFVACVTNPMTGRSSLQFQNDSELTQMALTQYRNTLSKSKVISNTNEAKQVKNVGQRIKSAAESYYNLIEDKQVNAWCMPGGKVAFYTGIMPICKTETGVAVVMGHEVAHALAGHGNERISSAMLAQVGGTLVSGAIRNNAMASVFNQLYPIGAQVGLLAYGRKQELEADEMGLYLMAIAGYDPREAQPFWHRMEAASGGARQPEFLSTHPSPENRRKDMDKYMPKALEYYKASGGK